MSTPRATGPGGSVVTQDAAVPDETLLVIYARGDAEAARELTDRMLPRALSVATRVLGDRAEAEDVAQEAMLRLWRIAPDWQTGQAKVSTWLYRVTMNLCIDLQRKRRGGTVALDDAPDPADNAPSAAEQLVAKARSDALQDALAQLPDRQRQAVVLRHLEELANPEIAEILGVSVEAVESIVARGKRGLTAALNQRRDDLGYNHG
ncbi:MAG: RNA polymerase sigma factor [Marinibacterium sp.]|nr:RNA polymerase sigma factor [Marinibacterium sp.]